VLPYEQEAPVTRTRQDPSTDATIAELFPGLLDGKDTTVVTKKVKAPPGKYDKVRKAIVARDIAEVSWELLDTTLTDIESTGVSPLGKSILMELIRTISVQKGNEDLEGRLQRVGELKTWLRKA
jgi:hypothetical protein